MNDLLNEIELSLESVIEQKAKENRIPFTKMKEFVYVDFAEYLVKNFKKNYRG